jgi:hypothetical protein
MKNYLLGTVLFALSGIVFGSQPTGRISKLDFFGTGVNEVIFVTIDSAVSACPNVRRYVMGTSGRPVITSAILSAFHAQTMITVIGTGACHAGWTNDEVLSYISISR